MLVSAPIRQRQKGEGGKGLLQDLQDVRPHGEPGTSLRLLRSLFEHTLKANARMEKLNSTSFPHLLAFLYGSISARTDQGFTPRAASARRRPALETVQTPKPGGLLSFRYPQRRPLII